MALTLKGHAKIAQRKVHNNLYLLHDFGYESIEKEKGVFFYKQINPMIGCLIYYYCSKQKDFSLHGFDLFIYSSTNSEDAINSYYGSSVCDKAEFLIAGFHAEKRSHRSCFIELDTEKKTTISQIDKKYMKEYHRWMHKDDYVLY